MIKEDRVQNSQLTPADSPSPIITKSDSAGYKENDSPHNYWEGVNVCPSRSPHVSWFGSSSLYYYLHRLSHYFNPVPGQPHTTSNMLPTSAHSSRLLGNSVPSSEELARRIGAFGDNPAPTGVFLTPVREQYFINHFWETYHTSVFPIVDELEFKKQYQSLWIGNGNTRKPSALVDIIVAMCMQFSISALPSDRQGGLGDNEDATLAGRWHFRRGQMLLFLEMESPTIATLQCHLLCVAYLCGGSFHNMVSISCALAVRTAHILGLHMECPDTAPESERQLRRRLWWAVCVTDNKVGMKLGRPFLINRGSKTVSLPSDSFEAAMTSGSTFAPIGQNATWLSFNLQQTLLFIKVRAAHEAYYGTEFSLPKGSAIWDDSKALEGYAEVMFVQIADLHTWAANVPGALRVDRQDGGQSFSTDAGALKIEQFSPLWLQRQRVLLEATYHHLSINLLRPFITFERVPPIGSRVEQLASKCAAHAVTLSTILHQILSSTSIFNGWHEAFQWQWSAAMTLVGYLLMYPQGASTNAARNAINLAISVFDIFGNSFAVGASAAKIMREMCSKVDFMTAEATSRHVEGSAEAGVATIPVPEDMDASGYMTGEDWENLVSDQNYSDTAGPGLFDMALDVEFWADLVTLWPQAEKLMQV